MHSPQRRSIDKTTTSDRQPLNCQNTFYKQFRSVYKSVIHIYQISRNTQALGQNPVCYSSPMEKWCQTAHIATIIKGKFYTLVRQKILTHKLYLILKNCFAVCFAQHVITLKVYHQTHICLLLGYVGSHDFKDLKIIQGMSVYSFLWVLLFLSFYSIIKLVK